MATSTVENYVKHIFLEQEILSERPVPMGRVAKAVGVTPGSATSMMKTLADAELVDYEPRVGVRLSKSGRRLALRVLRRARLIEYFLVKTLDLDWTEINDEAEELEHVISDRVLDALDGFLGNPKTDPHGDPIPTAEGNYEQRTLKALSQCHADQQVRIAQITDQEPDFLNFAETSGLTPGVDLIVTQRVEAADAITLSIGSKSALTITIGNAAAEKILVET